MFVKTVGIVSLSSGVLGEEFIRHEREIGLRRLEAYGLKVRFLPHALDGITALKAHPEYRAADLLAAFADPEIDMILCAIGGDDTYRLLPYLFDHGELERVLSQKIFLGFSDTTVNHLMLAKLGLPTFYGQAFLPDVCELDREMLPYTRRYFEELLATGGIREITPSPVWYGSRESGGGFGPDQIGVPPVSHPAGGFRLLQGAPVFSGKILGGCVESLFDLFDGGRYADTPALAARYRLFPSPAEWEGKILLLETSEEKIPPEHYRRMIRRLKETGVFAAVNGVLVGKPMDETNQKEYEEILVAEIGDPSLPVLADLNIGHAMPRCILPFGREATADAGKQTITFSR
ncbi:MAG: LD-carboxypeptidase [Clostridia bacterium]|nr:LD-carboxypeptidase [Clostridia bacterium]